jgi:hypothetical protein
MTSKELAAKGAEWMDADPKWFREIDENRLDMGSCVACVLSQYTCTSWATALYELGISEKFAEEYGFEISSDNFDVDYVSLTDAWRTEILNRKLGVNWSE